jgi:hypothetical protein
MTFSADCSCGVPHASSRLICYPGESRDPETSQNPGFRVALRLPGMTNLEPTHFWDTMLSQFLKDTQDGVIVRFFGDLLDQFDISNGALSVNKKHRSCQEPQFLDQDPEGRAKGSVTMIG